MTMWLGVVLAASSAGASPPDDCETRARDTARRQIDDAVETWRDVRSAYFAQDWKDRLAVASGDEREAVKAEREATRTELGVLRRDVRDARRALKEVKAQIAGGSVACGGSVAEEDAS